MKTIKFFICLLAIIIAVNTASAQTNKINTNQKKTEPVSDGSNCYDGSSKILNLGVGFGGFNYYRSYKGSGYSYHSTPAISLSYEQALPKKIGPGYIGVGGYLGFQTSSAKYNYDWNYNNNVGNYYYKYSWTNFMIAARGAYHLDDLVSKNTDLYAGILLGLRFQGFRYSSNNPDPNGPDYNISSGNLNKVASIFVGGRYYFSNQIAAFGEVGWGVSWLTLGLSYKL